MTILGISLGTLRTGICIMKPYELIEWQMHSYPTEWSSYKLRLILLRYEQYIKEYGITDIVLKIPPLKRHTKTTSQLIRRIAKLAKKHNCKFDLTTKAELKSELCVGNTEELIEYAIDTYPELLPTYERGQLTDQRDYKKLFEAVLSAHMYNEKKQFRKRISIKKNR